MLSNLSLMAQNLIALFIGGVIASLLTALFLLLYRLFVGHARPYGRDVMGTATAAFGGALAVAAAGAMLDGSSTEGMGGFFDGVFAFALAVAVVIAGVVYGRRVAGYQEMRSIGSDVVPLMLATVVGIVCTLFLAMLEQFS